MERGGRVVDVNGLLSLVRPSLSATTVLPAMPHGVLRSCRRSGDGIPGACCAGTAELGPASGRLHLHLSINQQISLRHGDRGCSLQQACGDGLCLSIPAPGISCRIWFVSTPNLLTSVERRADGKPTTPDGVVARRGRKHTNAAEGSQLCNPPAAASMKRPGDGVTNEAKWACRLRTRFRQELCRPSRERCRDLSPFHRR